MKTLLDSGIVSRIKYGVKLLANVSTSYIYIIVQSPSSVLPRKGSEGKIFFPPLNMDPHKKVNFCNKLYSNNSYFFFSFLFYISLQGKERFNSKINIEVSAASSEAIKTIEKYGGNVVSMYYSELALRSLLKPEKFDIPIKAPRPTPSKISYYTNYRNRGYLSSRLQLQLMKKSIAAAAGDNKTVASSSISSPVPSPSLQVPIYVGGAPAEMSIDDLYIPGQRSASIIPLPEEKMVEVKQ